MTATSTSLEGITVADVITGVVYARADDGLSRSQLDSADSIGTTTREVR